MSKNRNIRKKNHSDSDEEIVATTPSFQNKKKEIPFRNQRHFQIDDEDDTTEFQVKKSIESKKIKKGISQNLIATISVTPATYDHVAFGGEYSKETLEKLRQSQQFYTPTTENIDIEGVEFNGDIAESMEDIEFVSKHSNAESIDISEKSKLLPDYIPLRSTNNNPKKERYLENKTEFYSMEEEEDENDLWEDNIIKRAGLTKKSNRLRNQYNDDKKQNVVSSNASSSIDHIKSMLTKGIEAYTQQNERDEKQLNYLKSNYDFNVSEEMRLLSLVKDKSSNLIALQVCLFTGFLYFYIYLLAISLRNLECSYQTWLECYEPKRVLSLN